jgi:hypothetical protein
VSDDRRISRIAAASTLRLFIMGLPMPVSSSLYDDGPGKIKMEARF